MTDLKNFVLAQDESLVVSLIQRHLKYTGSAVARAILNDWDAAKAHFVKVFPHEFARAIKETADAEVCCPPVYWPPTSLLSLPPELDAAETHF